jgi:hypothetical protein
MVIPSFVPTGESARVDARSRLVGRILQGRRGRVGLADDTGRWARVVCRTDVDFRSRTRSSTGDPGLLHRRRKSGNDYATTPAKQAVRMRANPRGAVFVCVMRIMRIGLLSNRREPSP